VNPARRPLIAGNWKLNHGGPSGVDLAMACVGIKAKLPLVDMIIAPPFTALAACAHECEGKGVQVAAQNFYPKDTGAFTGEVSAPMLKDAGCTAVIIGHSERRQYFAETDAFVADKTKAALAAGLLPIVCVGETLEQRESGQTLSVVKAQIMAFASILAQTETPTAIAYEPVWAIGTGKTAAIRGWLKDKSPGLETRTRILYGGSVKGDNAQALLSCANVDGALVGGASLEPKSFGAIAEAAQALAVGK
jgi:triosephosphate isomerase